MTLTNLEIADALQRIAETLIPDEPDHHWVVFFETCDINGAPSYTFRLSVSYCETSHIAIREALSYMPELEEGMRIRGAFAARQSEVTEYDITHFKKPSQFEVR